MNSAYIAGYETAKKGLSIEECPKGMPVMHQHGDNNEVKWAETIQFIHWWKAGFHDQQMGY